MKKNTKSTGSPRKQASKVRHTKSKQKPVTIDLTAQKVEPKTTPKPAKENTGKTRSSVPKSSRPKTIAEAAARGKKPTSTPTPDFGQTTQPKTQTPEKPAQASKPEPKTTSAKPPFTRDPAPKTPTTPAPKSTPTNSGLFGKLAAGVIGGAVALGGAGTLQYLGVLSSPNSTAGSANTLSSTEFNSAREQLVAKIDALETRMAKAETPTSNPSALTMDSVKATIDAELKKLPANNQASTNLDAITGQIEETNSNLKTLQSQLLVTDKTVDTLKSAISTGDAGETAGLVTLNKTVAALEAKIDAIASTAQTLAVSSNENITAIAELQKQGANKQGGDSQNSSSAAAAQTATQSTNTKAAAEKTNKIIATLQSKLAALASTTQTLAEKSNAGQTAITALQKLTSEASSSDKQTEMAKTIAALQSKLDGVASTTQSLATRSNEREEAISSLQKQATVTANIGKQSANAIAAAALKSDIDRGLPFTNSLNRLKTLTGENAALTSLGAYAETGVPTQSQLLESFGPIGDQIVEALAPKPKDDLTSRIFASVKSLVKTKTIKQISGTTPAALVSQIAAGLTAGNLAQSSKAWSSLPDAGKEISNQWHDQLSARIAADGLVANTLQTFLLSNAGN